MANISIEQLATEIAKGLAEYSQELAGMLAIIDGMPAIFQTWAEPDTPFPYVVFRLHNMIIHAGGGASDV